jgi:hypothetical protein
MLRSTTAYRLFLGLIAGLAVTGITCAPRDETHVDTPPATGSKGNDGSAPPKSQYDGQPSDLVKVPNKEYLARIDAARESVRRRHPLTNHGFWTVFHYILGVGPEKAYLLDANDTRKLVKAIDYICEGNRMPGLVFEAKPDGTVNVVTQPGTAIGQGHQDQFVAEMTQWGLPREKVFTINGTRRTFDDFVRHSKNHASLGKGHELSWAVLIIGEHYGTDHQWTNNFGERMSLEDIVRYEIGDPINPTTTCGGTHRLFDLTWVYHRHRERGGKKEGVWLDAVKYLEKYKEQAKKFQNKDWTFSTGYVLEQRPDEDPAPAKRTELRINTTGHVLEWLALYLSDAELRELWVLNAAETLATLLVNNAHVEFDGGSLYHAAHALEIYRTRVFGPSDEHPPVIPLVPKD